MDLKKLLIPIFVLILMSTVQAVFVGNDLSSYTSYDQTQVSGSILTDDFTSNNYHIVGADNVPALQDYGFTFLESNLDYINMSKNVTDFTQNTNFTLNIWYYTSGTTGGNGHFFSGQGASSFFYSRMTTDGTIKTLFGDGVVSNSFTTTEAYNNSNWTMFTIISNTTDYVVLIDAIEKGYFSVNSQFDINDKFVVGANQVGTENINATLDEFGIWNRTLDQTELEYLFNDGKGRNYYDIITEINITTPELHLPVDGIRTYNITELNWTNSEQASGLPLTYYLEVDDDIDFSSPEYVNSSIAETENITGDTPPSNLSFGTYYWRVLATNTTLNSSWSETRSFSLASFIATINLFDETTGQPLNLNHTDEIRFLLFCPDRTETTILNQTTQNVTITCEYTKFRFSVDYNEENYFRSLILPQSEANNFSVYLLDLNTTNVIFNSFVLNDLLGVYQNVSMYIKKAINDEIVQIHADFADVENKVGAYLIESNQYFIEIHSVNQPTFNFGSYNADTSGEIILTLFNIGTKSSPTGWNSDVSMNTYLDNETTEDTLIVATYSDTGNNTNSVNFTVYKNRINSSVLYSSTSFDSDITFNFNASDYLGDTLVSSLFIDYADRTYSYGKTVFENTTINLPTRSYIKQEYWQWFWLVLFTVIGVYATIRTASPVALLLCGIAGFLFAVGWFNLSIVVLALITLVSLVSFIKDRDRESDRI